MDARLEPVQLSHTRRRASGRLRSDRARSAGRRRPRRLSGRRLPGPARGRGRAGLGLRRIDRRHQRGDHCRQPPGTAAGTAAHVLGAHHRSQDLELHAGRRRLPQGAQRHQLMGDHPPGPARLLLAATTEPLVEPRRGADRDQLLRQRAAARDARGARRFLADQREGGSLCRRRRQRAQRQLHLLRQRPRDIEPEHVMASGALPPALPMVKIGTDHFWDGGIVSNTPLQHLLDQDDISTRWSFRSTCSARAASCRATSRT